VLSLFLFLILVAVALGIIGVVVNGLLYVLIIGIIVFVLAFLLLGWSVKRSSRARPAR